MPNPLLNAYDAGWDVEKLEMLEGWGLDPVFGIWGLQPDGYFCLSFRPVGENDKFHDVWWLKSGRKFTLVEPPLPYFIEWRRDETGGESEIGISDVPYETYFCVAGFYACERRVHRVMPSRWLFADLDWVPPHELTFIPTYSWQTSPGKWQCVWMMPDVLEPSEFSHLNRAICHTSGADPGTWNVNRLLRAPKSAHLKHLRSR